MNRNLSADRNKCLTYPRLGFCTVFILIRTYFETLRSVAPINSERTPTVTAVCFQSRYQRIHGMGNVTREERIILKWI
jgi:hypothetical protein